MQNIRVLWPRVCMGCGTRKFNLSEHSYIWRDLAQIESRQSDTGKKLITTDARLSMLVEAFLCSDCRNISSEIRSIKLEENRWRGIFAAITLIIIGVALSLLILIDLIWFIGWIFYVVYSLMIYSWFRETKLKFSNASTPFHEIFPYVKWRKVNYQVSRAESIRIIFIFRSPEFFSKFKQLNPSLDVVQSNNPQETTSEEIGRFVNI